MHTRNLIFILIALFALSATASATAINCQPPYCAAPTNVLFDLSGASSSGSFGNVRTITSEGLTVTITSYGLTGNQGATFETAATGRWSNGLGVYDQKEGLSAGGYNHAVDNSGYSNFVLFQFDKPVDPLSIYITQYNYDSDLSYWTGNLTGSMIGQTLAGLGGLGFGSQYTNNGSGSRYVSFTSPTVNALLVAAKIGESNDFFKIDELCVDYIQPPPPGEIPEPSTYATMGGALLGIGVFIARRRKQQA